MISYSMKNSILIYREEYMFIVWFISRFYTKTSFRFPDQSLIHFCISIKNILCYLKNVRSSKNFRCFLGTRKVSRITPAFKKIFDRRTKKAWDLIIKSRAPRYTKIYSLTKQIYLLFFLKVERKYKREAFLSSRRNKSV